MADGILTPCNVASGSGIVTVNSPSGSTMQCDTWLWDDMPLNSLKRPPYWNSTSGFHFHTSPQSTCHSVPVCEILSKSDHPRHNSIRCIIVVTFQCSHLCSFITSKRCKIHAYSLRGKCCDKARLQRHNSTQLNSTRQREQQLTQFVGRDIINKNTTDLAVRCSTGSVEFS